MRETAALADKAYRNELSQWLQSYHWDYFHTITFRTPRRDRIAAIRDIKDVCSRFTSRAFIAVEPHCSGYLHAHAISFQNSGMHPYYLPWEVEGAYRKRFGISAVTEIQRQEEVAGYCSKYVLKNLAEYDFTGARYHWKECCGLLSLSS